MSTGYIIFNANMNVYTIMNSKHKLALVDIALASQGSQADTNM